MISVARLRTVTRGSTTIKHHFKAGILWRSSTDEAFARKRRCVASDERRNQLRKPSM